VRTDRVHDLPERALQLLQALAAPRRLGVRRGSRHANHSRIRVELLPRPSPAPSVAPAARTSPLIEIHTFGALHLFRGDAGVLPLSPLTWPDLRHRLRALVEDPTSTLAPSELWRPLPPARFSPLLAYWVSGAAAD
jgi:hypothetical protein